jgi:hypothetical protein
MAGPAVQAKDLPIEWAGSFPPRAWLRPQYRRLGVGFSHAVFILLSINFGAIRRALAYERCVGRVKCFNWAEDRRTRLQLSQRQVAVYAHLDYVGGLASNRPLACQLPLNTSLKGSASVLGPAISMMEAAISVSVLVHILPVGSRTRSSLVASTAC